MAFKMNRPLIKGTPIHKASIAKAKQESIVTQTRTQADSGLVDAAGALGRSYIPAAIDFSRDLKGIKIPKSKEDKGNNKSKTKKDLGKTSNKTKVAENYDNSGLVNPETKGGDYNLEINYPEEEDVKKKVEKDVLIGDTESADSKYVAPYIEEAEDEDDDYSGIENDKTITDDPKPKPYRTFVSRKEEQENIARAEENKAKLDAQTAEKVKRRDYKVSKIEPKNVEQIPTTAPEPKVEKVNQSSKVKTKDYKPAHLDPNLNNKVNTDIEGTGNLQTPRLSLHDQYAANLPEDAEDHFTGSYNDYAYTTVMTDIDGDGELDEQEVWTYKGNVINENQVSTDAYTSILGDLSNKQEQKNNKEIKQKKENLNSNTPSNDSTANTLLPIVPTLTNEVEQTKQVSVKPKPSDFRPKKNAFGGTLTANEQYQKALKEYNSKSPMEMRDDRIYRNALPDGLIRKNMIKGGYTPKN